MQKAQTQTPAIRDFAPRLSEVRTSPWNGCEQKVDMRHRDGMATLSFSGRPTPDANGGKLSPELGARIVSVAKLTGRSSGSGSQSKLTRMPEDFTSAPPPSPEPR